MPFTRSTLRTLLPVATLWLVGAASPASLQPVDDAFVCPEALPTDQARMAALKAFLDGYARLKPDATIADMTAFRRAMLIKHHCASTLAHMEGSDQEVVPGEARDQAWVPIARHGGIALAMSRSHLVAVLDPRAPGEKAVDAYARITLAAPATTDATHTHYDELVSHTVYYCRSRRYALVENDYWLAGREVLKDPSTAVGHSGATSLYPVTDIPPGSLNDEAASWACAASTETAG